MQVEQQTAVFPGRSLRDRQTGRPAARRSTDHGQTESLSRTGSVEFQTRPSLQCLMETEAVRRKHCLLRLRENCPFRKLRRHTYGQFRGVFTHNNVTRSSQEMTSIQTGIRHPRQITLMRSINPQHAHPGLITCTETHPG